jgi:hypothetical protein
MEAAAAAPEALPTEAEEAKPKRRRRGSSGEAKAEAAGSPPAEPKRTAGKTKPPSGKTAAEPSTAKTTARKQSKP